MKNILLLVSAFFLLACNTNVEQKVETATASVTSPTAQESSVKRDTMPPVKKRSNYMADTARPEAKINKTFPYDIPLKTAAGEVLNSENELKPNGKPTVLLFWLTTCAPCAMEMKAISEKYEGWQKETDFNLVAISTDFSKNYPNFVKRVEDKKWPWKTYNDVHREFRKVMPGGLNGLPQTFLLDKEGKIIFHKRKYRSGDEDKLYEQVKALASAK
ncbi:MAG: cytochrome c biogenesis protein CcmG/thiol:disulfide interchange protein DsbE [Polaribacter sp.]|jgi:cytochrome c biogenesis protein CcmG/thiol:disulfide interchange protein DsbE